MALPPLTDTQRQALAWLLLRLTLAGLVAAHGWARLGFDAVKPFGLWLSAQGWPAGPQLAMAITGLEMVGPLLLAMGRGVRPLCLTLAGIYAMGIALVHAKAGWFVVGLGRNGSEYSVLLIVCLLLLAWQHRPTPYSSTPSTSPSPST